MNMQAETTVWTVADRYEIIPTTCRFEAWEATLGVRQPGRGDPPYNMAPYADLAPWDPVCKYLARLAAPTSKHERLSCTQS